MRKLKSQVAKVSIRRKHSHLSFSILNASASHLCCRA